MQNKRSQIILGQLRSLLIYAVIGLIAGAFIWWFISSTPNASKPDISVFAGVVSQITATMAGFIVAVMAILLSLTERELLKRMAKSGHFQVLILRMVVSALMCMLTVAISITTLVAPVSSILWTAFIFGAVAACIASVFDVVIKFAIMLFFLVPIQKTATDDQEKLYFD